MHQNFYSIFLIVLSKPTLYRYPWSLNDAFLHNNKQLYHAGDSCWLLKERSCFRIFKFSVTRLRCNLFTIFLSLQCRLEHYLRTRCCCSAPVSPKHEMHLLDVQGILCQLLQRRIIKVAFLSKVGFKQSTNVLHHKNGLECVLSMHGRVNGVAISSSRSMMARKKQT